MAEENFIHQNETTMEKEEKTMSLTVENLKVVLQKKEILHGISLDIGEGEFISLLGASGCGKTTLLKSIGGLLEIEQGDIRIKNTSVVGIPPEKRGTVIVFQDLRLFPHMTVEQNIAFPMELQKVPKHVRKETVKKLLEDVQLSGFENRKIKEMSGGQMQRIALARALAANPGVLLLDEPFSGLDECLRLEMGNLVKKLHRERKITTILVTHEKREAMQMSDRIALMSQGQILQFDTPRDLFRHPASRAVAEYFGRVNYVKGRIENHRFYSSLFEMRTEMEDGEYEAMIRPFSVKLEREGANIISEITFMGELAEVKMEIPEGMIISQVMSHELERLGLEEGDRRGILIEEKGVTLFRRGA
ncbi:ABC transporter related protein [[Clostridium] saccharolyticum WM1]|uniref:ABC-type quaternary amine transporter n=2 Tax=Lacrimispora TaxID=2719231 RepID=D9R838_LACSW|nr:ABC transporter related protein [[Clostridium] saccharolyticum WM1]